MQQPGDDWWQTFFQGAALEMWTRAVPPERTKAEADSLEKALGVPAGAKVLDVPCGNGRLALDLAGRGYRMTGIDLAAEYIEGAKRQSAEKGLAVDWRQGDMRHLPFSAEFDAAYCFGNSFAYFDDAGNASFLESVARSLKPGGRFILDTYLAAENILPNLVDRYWYEMGDLFFLAQRRYDPLRGRLDVEYLFLRDGTVDRRPVSYRIYLARQIVAMLEQVGFAGVEALGSFEREPYALASPRLLLVGRRKSA